MAYMIKTDNELISVIDGGGAASSQILEDYLIQFGGRLSTCIITHPHEDHHIGTFLKVLIKAGLK